MKKCRTCEIEKSLDRFSVSRGSRDGLRDQCKECVRVYNQEYYAKNPQYHRDRVKAYTAANTKERNAYYQTYRTEKRDLLRAKSRRKYWNNPTPRREYAKQYRIKNLERRRAIFRSWQIQNPDKLRAFRQKRRAIKIGVGGNFSENEWKGLKAFHNYTCLRCGRVEPEITLTADHVIPISKGGSNWIENIQPLCKSCNSAKHTQSTDYRTRKPVFFRQMSLFDTGE